MKNRLIFFLVLGSFQLIQAELFIPETDDEYYTILFGHKMSVVHFNPYPLDEKDEPLLDRMKDAFVSLSNSDRYKEADVAFIGVNLQKIPELADDYDLDVPDFEEDILDDVFDKDDDGLIDDDLDQKNVKKETKDNKKSNMIKQDPQENEDELKPEEQSTLILFGKKGEPLMQNGKRVQRTGFMTKIQMEDFIDHYFGEAIKKIRARKEEQKRLRLKARQEKAARDRAARQARTRRVYRYIPDQQYAQRTYYSRPYYGYSYGRRPYWRRAYFGGYPYGYWPGFGTGFGFGGRRGGFSFGFGW